VLVEEGIKINQRTNISNKIFLVFASRIFKARDRFISKYFGGVGQVEDCFHSIFLSVSGLTDFDPAVQLSVLHPQQQQQQYDQVGLVYFYKASLFEILS